MQEGVEGHVSTHFMATFLPGNLYTDVWIENNLGI